MSTLFNREAAEWAREIVMKMDDDEAVEFVRHVVHETLHQDMAANRRAIIAKVAEINKEMLADLERTVSKSASVEVAKALVIEVAKAERSYNRDESGRFATINTLRPGVKVLSGKERKRFNVPEPTNVSGKKVRLSDAQKAAFQDQYVQLLDVMDRFAAQDIQNPRLVLRDRINGRTRVVPVGNKKLDEHWDPARQDLVGVRGAGSDVGDASFDLVSAIGGSTTAASRAASVGDAVERRGDFAERWNDASRDEKGATNSRTYRRIGAGGKLLNDLSGPGEFAALTPAQQKLRAAGKFGEFVGEFGPEAEKVIGPNMRRTAYRYRGTERTPDKELLNQHAFEMRRAQLGSFAEDPAHATALAQKSAANYLLNRLPSPRLATIQRKSGRIPPSEGVIIDKNGKVVVQASGFAEDHYLPFNLKNLKSLKGGSYVRTRSSGGLTTEDIYTGLVSGARSVTVVSNSGIFTVHFSDDFRGGRRHSDKANSMVTRYAKTLDAIKEGQIDRPGAMSDEVKASIRDEVEEKYKDAKWMSRSSIEAEVAAAIDEYKKTPHQISTKELEYIEARAKQEAGEDQRKYKIVRSNLLEQAKEAKTAQFYRLDGEGYAAAAEALREQYPYFIENVNFMHRREGLVEGQRTDKDAPPNELQRRFSAAAVDAGYVKARHNRPDEVMEGFFDVEIAGEGEIKGTGKTRASHTNYQNWEHNPTRKGRLAPVDAEDQPAAPGKPQEESKPAKPALAAAGGSGGPQNPEQRMAEALARSKQDRVVTDAIESLVSIFGATVNEHTKKNAYPLAHRASTSDEGLDAVDRDLLLAELDRAVTEARSSGWADIDDIELLYSKATSKKAGEAGEQWDKDKHLGKRHKSPLEFSEPIFKPGAPASAIREEIKVLGSRIDHVGVKYSSTLSDAKLAKIAEETGKAAVLLRGHDSTSLEQGLQILPWAGSDTDRIQMFRQFEGNAEARSQFAEKLVATVESIERVRRLKANLEVSPDGPDNDPNDDSTRGNVISLTGRLVAR